jgi:hypothetical protein
MPNIDNISHNKESFGALSAVNEIKTAGTIAKTITTRIIILSNFNSFSRLPNRLSILSIIKRFALKLFLLSYLKFQARISPETNDYFFVIKNQASLTQSTNEDAPTMISQSMQPLKLKCQSTVWNIG